MRRLLSCLLLSLAIQGACAAPAPVADAALEKRVMAISEELRCLVCQNQTIADSQAELAVDLRNQVREKLQQGMSERDIVDFMVTRYGDFVLYRPPVKGSTWLLWFGPALLLLGGIVALGLKLARPRNDSAAPSADELARAARLLDEKGPPP